MQTLNRTVISGVAADQSVTSVALSTLTLSALSVQVTVSGGSAISGVFHVDGSNEDTPLGWAESVGSVAVSGNGISVVGPLALCFRWTRLRWVPSGGTGGSLTASVMAQSGPSPSNGLTSLTPDPSGTFTNSTVTVDEFGRVTAAASGSAAAGALPIEAARIEYGAIADLFFSFSGVTVTASGTSLGTGTLRARPIVFGVDGTVSVLGIIVGIGVATAVVRVGLYESGTDGLPSTLLVESGELDCSTNTRKITTGLSAAVRADRAYWFAALAGTATPNLISPNTAERLAAVLATEASTTGALFGHLAVAQAYGALPATWPSGAATNAAVNAVPMPLIGVSR